jgi:hypothetical protein
VKKILMPLLFAFLGWAFCAAIMGIGPLMTSMRNTLILHAVAGPLAFGLLAFIYQKKYGHFSPMVTAAVFIAFVILVDFFLVAMLILKDYAMFDSVSGTWLPFILIFLVSYGAGRSARRKKPAIK